MEEKEMQGLWIDLNLMYSIGLDSTLVYEALKKINNETEKAEEDFFSATFEDISIYTTFNKAKLQKIVKSLEELNLIETDSRGLPRRQHCKIKENDSTEQILIELRQQGKKELTEKLLKRKEIISNYYK